MKKAAIILCGGKSSRMGRDKATLPFGPESMLQRVVRLLCEVVEPSEVVVVAAIDQSLPRLPEQVTVTFDRRQDCGPLEGLSAGMNALGPDVEAAFVTSCDVPLLVPAFVVRMFELLGEHDIAVPREQQQLHPLAAVYRPLITTRIQQLLRDDRLRMRGLFDESNTRYIDVEMLRSVDPDLRSLVNLNHLDDYHAALKAAGFP